MATYFVRYAAPFRHLNGAVSFGTHVTTDSERSALDVVRRITGLEGEAIARVEDCQSIFDCAHGMPAERCDCGMPAGFHESACGIHSEWCDYCERMTPTGRGSHGQRYCQVCAPDHARD